MYKENPKTKGSGIVCCIPQTCRCPMGCEDCFFQSGRSFLEPLDENLPNMPETIKPSTEILRVNDGNDSNVDRENVIRSTEVAKGRRFFNTSIPRSFDEPWVLTINPGLKTNKGWIKVDPTDTDKLMFVRFRINMWNFYLAQEAVAYYTGIGVPVVLTFMAYFNETVKEGFEHYYEYRKRTLNSYWVIKFDAWRSIMDMFIDNPLVYSCSGPNNFKCAHCGTCLREFYRVCNK